jgi:O-acetyl-ADP-ribose deacetylase (regulator of RNase III)
MPFKIVRNDITKMQVDAIVNTANSNPTYSSGTDSAVYIAAGEKELLAERRKIGHMKEGEAAITPGFRLSAKYIIHAVGPIYQDGHHNERELLYSAYQSALKLAVQYDCRSVGFPLISAGIYGYPVDEAWTVATEACSDFIRSHPETDIKIIFAVLNDDMLAKGKAALQKVQ